MKSTQCAINVLLKSRRIKVMSEKVKKITIKVLNKATTWMEKEATVMKSKFETRFIKTIRSAVVLSCVLVLINVLLILRG